MRLSRIGLVGHRFSYMVTVRNLVSPWVIPSRRLHHLAPSASHRGRLYHQAPMNRFQPKKVVEEGYDRIGELYARDASLTRQELRSRQVSYLMNALPRGSDLLDLGCGAGTPTTKRLAEYFTVTGVDISQRQVERARRDIPDATFIRADMTSLRLPPCSYDAVTAFFSIIHVPRDEQPDLLRSIATWLRPNGLFFATMTARSKEIDFDACWMGAPMFWSGHDSDTNKRIVREAGLEIVSVEETQDSDGHFLWLMARKPGEQPALEDR